MATDEIPRNTATTASSSSDDLLMEEFSSRSRCCFHLPCFGSSAWEKLRHSPDIIDDNWWTAPFKKLREWSEIAAGPKWKTFIRRFNRRGSGRTSATNSKFNYDPLSYSLNFDEGPGQNAHSGDEFGRYPDFSSRYALASLPNSCKSSMDLGRNGIPLPLD